MSGTSTTLLGSAAGAGIDYSPGFPDGLGHLANFAHLVQMSPGPAELVPQSARLKTDDVRILACEWRLPGRLPVINGDPRPVRRVAMTFTPDHFSGQIEYASRDFTPDPHAGWGLRPGVSSLGYMNWPSLPPGAPGGRILVLATPDVYTENQIPSFGHQIPSTCVGFGWFPYAAEPTSGPGHPQLSDLWQYANPTDPYVVLPDQYHFVSFYFTDNAESDNVRPEDIDMWSPAEHAPRWTYPWTVAPFIEP